MSPREVAMAARVERLEIQVRELESKLNRALETLDIPEPDHESKNCWLAGNDGHLRCDPPALTAA